MMKRLAALMLAVMVMLSMTTAFAWTCPNCGAAMENKFCSECGAKKPENICPGCGFNHGENAPKFCPECGTKMDGAAPAATPTAAPAPQGPVISDVFENDNGSVSIMWDDDGKTKYTIECIQRLSDDPQADRAANNGFFLSRGTYDIGFYTISRLIPGESYWIGVFDGEGRGNYIPFEPETQPEAFSEFPLSLTVKLKTEQDGTQNEVDQLTVQEIAGGTKVGLYVVLSYENPGEKKSYITQIVVEAPNGASWVVNGYANINEKANAATGWNFLNLTDYFSKLQSCFGSILAGDYKVKVYVHGDQVGEASFQVAAEAAPAVTAAPVQAEVDYAALDNIVSNGDGTVTVSWTGGTAPYKVLYTRKVTDDFDADRIAAREAGDYWIGATGVEGNSQVLSRLIPGVPYWIVVMDANDRGQRRAFVWETEAFTDFPVTLEVKPREKTGETPVDLDFLPADTTGLDDDTIHGLYMLLSHDNPGEARDLYTQIVLSYANGFEFVYVTGSLNYASGEDCWRKWEFYDMEDIMGHVREYHGSIPVGDMTVSVYLNGKLAASAAVPVGQGVPLNITGCALQSNGWVLLTWEDNGCGPYDVYYHQRFTDDIHADQNDARGTGGWYDEREVQGTSLAMKYLMPGKDYWISLEDSKGTVAVYAYTAPAVVNSNLEVTMSCNPRIRDGENLVDMSSFSSAAITAEHTEEYGLYLDVTYREHKADVKRASQFVITLPNGQSLCSDSFDMTWFAGNGCHWEFFDLEWFFSRVVKWHGKVLTGTYTLELFPEGKYAGSVTFEVTE